MTRRLLALIGMTALTLGLAAAPATLLSFDDLAARLKSDDLKLRLLDVRPREDYLKSHIPGAVWLDAKRATAIAGAPEGLLDKDAWSAWIAPLGIGPDTEVIVYGDNRQLDAARAWWFLKYLGVGKVGLLDGNFSLWSKEGRPVLAQETKVEPRAFPIAFQADRSATRAEVLAAIEGKQARVIDARSEAEHVGTKAMSKRGGHIPSACHVDWTELVTPDGRFLDESAIRARIAPFAIKPGEPVITHCQGGGRASVDAFVFERLGFSTRNYYRGWSDWGNQADTPVVTGKEPKP